ncbi:hypothetical protein [Williamsia deligens]|uniref:Uncharacterized protein n=1 Tax=Williamsia deligens TaxID=321325 RepID=A0ABW3G4T9_9NOCA|nr:hypothetical protein [Williamsia deligens]MCP2193998.1 hypothetical protein [Williamsia deligens]
MQSVFTRVLRATVLAVAALTAVLGLSVVGVGSAGAATVTKVFYLNAKTAGANGNYFDTGITLPAGASATVSASGTAKFDPGYPSAGPNGSVYTCTNAIVGCPLLNAPYLALIGKVGDQPSTLLGAGPSTATGPGRLKLAINDAFNGYVNNSGRYRVAITYTRTCPGLVCIG